jgi:hypothetical protein
MDMKKTLVYGFVVSSLLIANVASAGMVSDAPAPYGAASHQTAEWQKLGEDNTIDDGVWWSVDDGATWGHETLDVGDNVVFRFDLWTSGSGEHDYNQVKAWVDWNQDGVWSNDATEIVLEEQVFQMPNNPKPVPGITSLLSASYLITDEMIGNLWLRARAQCNHVPYGEMTPYGDYWQGEVEDWQLTVDKPTPTPEPATLLLMSVGLFGLVGARIRRE